MSEKELNKIIKGYENILPEDVQDHLISDIEKLRKESEEAKNELKKYKENLSYSEINFLRKNLSQV